MTGASGRVVVAFVLLALLSLHHGIVSTFAQTLRDDESHLFAFLENALPGYPAPFNASVPTCQWPGLSCIGLGAQQRIKTLSLVGLGLNGSIPYNTLGALTSLTYLDLSDNLLSGEIPWDIWDLPNLMHLRVSSNKAVGVLPKWVNLHQLLELNLSGNCFSGPVADSFGANLKYLRVLDLHGNNFSGPMPALTDNMFLSYLDLSSNQFMGAVSYTTFAIQELVMVNLSSNLLSGPLPHEFGWLWRLQTLDLSKNDFDGPIPGFYNLGQLRQFYLSSNRLNGTLPVNLTQLPSLQALGVANNKLTGSLPPLPWGNILTLRFLDCSDNLLSGSIPWDLLGSESLAVVRLARNRFTGSIPTNVTIQMREIDLGGNNFTGDIPPAFTSAHMLEKLDVSSNHLNGSIPWGSIGALPALRYLNLAQNPFTEGASLPSFDSKFGNLTYLNLSSSYVNGSIPDSIGELRSLLELDLSHNQVTGAIPGNLSQASNLLSLDLSYNNLTGEIPPELVSLMNLSRLDLSFNNLTGVVPDANQWALFTNLSYEGNAFLCGPVVSKPCPNSPSPAPSPKAPVLVAAPSSVIVPPILHRNSSAGLGAGAVAGIMIGVSLAFCALLSTYVLFHKKNSYMIKKQRKESTSTYLTGPVTFEADPCAWASQVPQPASIPVIMFEKPLLNLTFADLLQATNKFHKDSQIADGRYGPTFKGSLPGGFQIVVKVLYDGGPANELEKAAELEAIGKIRHENLVSLVGYCLVKEERLLVYEFMENGDVYSRLHDSLDEIHHPENWTKETWADANEKFVVTEELGWPARHRIAVGVARALAFLHHGCVPSVVHRDVTSSSILLDAQLDPHLADCGLAELVESGARYVASAEMGDASMAGTPGYVPPEYNQTWKATARGDVYSFGVVLLELVTGKRPTGQYFYESYGGNLVGWVRTLIRDKRGYKCLDPKLLSSGVESELLECLRIGYLCTAEIPAKRPTMQQVVGLLKDIHVDVVTCM